MIPLNVDFKGGATFLCWFDGPRGTHMKHHLWVSVELSLEETLGWWIGESRLALLPRSKHVQSKTKGKSRRIFSYHFLLSGDISS